MQGLKACGVQTSIHYPPVHLFDFYQRTFGPAVGSLPLTEAVAQRELTLPFYPTMQAADVSYVCDALEEILAPAPHYDAPTQLSA